MKTISKQMCLLVGAFSMAMLLLSGCSHIEPRVAITEPTSVRPVPASLLANNNGAIYQPATFRPYFEDTRARLRGDILTVVLNERNSATRASSSTAEKKNDVTATIPTTKGLPIKYLQGLNLGAGSSNAFSGKGDASNNNTFEGTIAVTVIDVLPNGNLLVSGEKQIGINHNLEIIRFSGVVNPINVLAGNMVDSTKVADARLAYTGKGYIDEAQRMSWLSRFFLNFLPF